jgi:hypothetical protein
MTCRVIHGGTKRFNVLKEVRQGCLLLPFLFLLAIGWLIEISTKGKRNGIQWILMEQLDDLGFADDLALLSHTNQQMQDKTNTLAQCSPSIGCNSHRGKKHLGQLSQHYPRIA